MANTKPVRRRTKSGREADVEETKQLRSQASSFATSPSDEGFRDAGADVWADASGDAAASVGATSIAGPSAAQD